MIDKILTTGFYYIIFGMLGHQVAVAEDWWQFRGPNGGQVAERQVPTRWGSSSREPVWKTTTDRVEIHTSS